MNNKCIILFNNKVTITYPLAAVLEHPERIPSFLAEGLACPVLLTYVEGKLLLERPATGGITMSLNGKTAPGSIVLAPNDLLTCKYKNDMCYLLYTETTQQQTCAYIKIPEGETLGIGRRKDSGICIDHPAVLEKHAELRRTGGTLYMKAASQAYTYVNGILHSDTALQAGDQLQILHCTIYCMGDILCVVGPCEVAQARRTKIPVQEKNTAVPPMFTPVPRIYRSTDQEDFVIDPPPALTVRRPVPFLLSAGPSMTMSLVTLVSAAVGIGNAYTKGVDSTVITSAMMALSMLAGALLWPWLLRRYQEKQDATAEALRKAKYTAYIRHVEEAIQQIYDHNYDVMGKYQSPATAQLTTVWDGAKAARFLWERRIEDIDFLSVRLGCGRLRSDITVQITEPHFSMQTDPLTDLQTKIATKYAAYEAAPITISLRENRIVGLFGKALYTDRLLQNIMASLLILHTPQNVHTAFLFSNDSQAQKYAYLADVPHVWSCDTSRRFFAADAKSIDAVLTYMYNQVNIPAGAAARGTESYYVVFAWERQGIEDSALYQCCRTGAQVSFVFIAEEYGSLPQDCMAVIQCSRELYGVYEKNKNDNRLLPFAPDTCDPRKLQEAIRKLGALSIPAAAQAVLPDRVAFLDMFRAGNVHELGILQRWQRKTSHASLATPIGAVKGGDILTFDIHEAFHGCHGIVAGTTGSGKSEFLQSYILSMMVNYSPEDVNFVLIDFKGGDIATPFRGLPHLCAVISNLSKNILYRAMVSLEAEQIRRQKLFDQKKEELGLDKIDINSYQKLYHAGVLCEPLPHIIIIMDEFAQFKNQHGEYMQKLINIAQIGRSLGIHLILATQKPDGVVDSQIWGNSRFKFCLKVLEREDSKAVLRRDEAAFIQKPGTAYLQVGYNEIFSQFQSGYCRAKYMPRAAYSNAEDITVRLVDSIGNVLAEAVDDEVQNGQQPTHTETQITAVVKELQRVSATLGYTQTPLWLPELPAYVYVEDCPAEALAEGLAFAIGLMDIPTEQKQSWHIHSFLQDGNMAIYGAAGTGKTTVVQSLLFQGIRRYTPMQFQYCILDIHGKSYAPFLHTTYDFGSAVAGEQDKLEVTFQKLTQELAYRKELFVRLGVNAYAELLHKAPDTLPMLVVVLENYVKFRESAFAYEEQVIDVVSSGQTYGIYCIVTTNSKAGIYYKVQEQLAKVITLRMIDAEAYRDLLDVAIAVDMQKCKGRAFVRHHDQAVEMQIALPIRDPAGSNRLQAMEDVLQRYRVQEQPVAPPMPAPAPVVTQVAAAPAIPIAKAAYTYVSAPQTAASLAVGYALHTQTPVYVDLQQHKRIYICSEHIRDFADRLGSLLPADTVYKKWTLTGREEALGEILQEVEDCVAQEVLPILFIPDFIRFYQDISNADADRLARFIDDHEEPVYITCAGLEELPLYSDTPLHVLLCKRASVILFTDGVLRDSYANLLNAYVYRMDRDIRTQAYTAEQYFVAVQDTFTVTDGGGEGA